nr:MAG TPA: hypothetical protein [Caudoviricetes sp.]
MTTNYLSRPKMVKTFAINAMNANHLAVRFGTNRLAKDVESIANDNFEYGIESLEGDLQPRDLNSVLKYLSANLTYLFQQGVAEFSPYQDYPLGALAQHDGSLWITTKEIKASKHEPKFDPCNPCAISKDCEVATVPSEETGWCRLITYCEYKNDLDALHKKDEALGAAVADLKGVKGFSIVPNANNGFLELNLALSNGKSVVIPMTKFGHIEQNKDGTLSITNADGTTLKLPKYVAENDLDQQKGFFFNAQSNKWEVDLSDLVKDGSGLEVDRNGNIKVKPAEILDGNTLSVDPVTGKARINPEWYKTKVEAPIATAKDGATTAAKSYTDNKLAELKEQGAKVYANSPFTGNGTKVNPLSLGVSEEFEVIGGKLYLKGTEPKEVTDLNNLSAPIRRLGFTPFFGNIQKSSNTYVVGMPADFEAESPQTGTTTNAEIKDGSNYDFNGWQLASSREVQQFISNNGITWERSNDLGMRSDGTLVNPSSWSTWKRSTNVNITSEQVKNLVNQLVGLTSRLGTAEQKIQSLEAKNNETCKVPCKNINSNYTVLDSDNTIISVAHDPITVTFPNNIPTGRMFTIIQAGAGEITLANAGNNSFIAPREGGFKLGGVNAVVTVLYELGNTVRVFGDTKA